MAANFMATSRMTIVRVFIDNELLIDNNWVLVNGSDELGSGTGSLSEILQLEYEHLEIYLSPLLATIFKVEIEHISDRKVNDELLLGLIEDNLVEEIENCKPLLMRVSDGQSYIAVVTQSFYKQLIESLQDHVKKVKFIQPLPFLTDFDDSEWTVYLSKEHKFVRVSMFEYFQLDDAMPIPDVLDAMLQGYDKSSIKIYSDDDSKIEYIEKHYKLKCHIRDSLNFGVLNWNFYNEKSKRFNLKLDDNHKKNLLRLTKSISIFLSVFVFFWIINLCYLVIAKYRLQSDITKDLNGIVRVDSYQPNLLSKVNDQLNAIYHTKGLYASNDFASLFDVFLRTMPEINQSMIVGIKYSSGTLNVFLNSQFSNSNFDNDKEILLTKRILANITDYKSYQAQNSNSQNNNGGGLLDSNSDSTSQQMADAAWVISLQPVTRLDVLNDSSVKTTK